MSKLIDALEKCKRLNLGIKAAKSQIHYDTGFKLANKEIRMLIDIKKEGGENDKTKKK